MVPSGGQRKQQNGKKLHLFEQTVLGNNVTKFHMNQIRNVAGVAIFLFDHGAPGGKDEHQN